MRVITTGSVTPMPRLGGARENHKEQEGEKDQKEMVSGAASVAWDMKLSGTPECLARW